MVQRDLVVLTYGVGKTIMDIAKHMRQLLIGSTWGAGEGAGAGRSARRTRPWLAVQLWRPWSCGVAQSQSV